MARPRTATLPEFGRTKRAAIRSNVVFPAPLGPKKRDEFSGLDFKTNATQSGECAVTLFDLIENESETLACRRRSQSDRSAAH